MKPERFGTMCLLVMALTAPAWGSLVFLYSDGWFLVPVALLWLAFCSLAVQMFKESR